MKNTFDLLGLNLIMCEHCLSRTWFGKDNRSTIYRCSLHWCLKDFLLLIVSIDAIFWHVHKIWETSAGLTGVRSIRFRCTMDKRSSNQIYCYKTCDASFCTSKVCKICKQSAHKSVQWNWKPRARTLILHACMLRGRAREREMERERLNTDGDWGMKEEVEGKKVRGRG